MSKKDKDTESTKPKKDKDTESTKPKKDKDTESTKPKKDKHTAPDGEAEATETAASTKENVLEDLPFKERDAQKAYEKHLEACEAIPAKTATTPSFAISDAIMLGLLVAKHAEQDKKRLKKLHEIGESNYDLIMQLYSLTLALSYAEMRWRNARKQISKTPKKTVGQQAKDIRKELLDAADYVWRNDPDIKETLKEIREGSGLRDLAEDLQRLAALFLDNWSDVQGRSEITHQDLESAEQTALDVLDIVLLDEQKEALLIRNRVFALFQQAYAEACETGRFLYRNTPKEAAERYPGLRHTKTPKKPQNPPPQPPIDTPSPQ